MRLSNRSHIPLFNFIDSLMMMQLFLGVVAFFIDTYRFRIMGAYAFLLIVIPAIVFIIYYIRGRQIFEYDSDGEALNFKNRNISPFFHKPLNDEFPKYKLIKYEVVDLFIYRRLYVNITSKKNHTTILKYDISCISRKEVNDLKFSLNKIVKINNEKTQLP